MLLGASGSPNVGDVKGDSAVSYAASTGNDQCLEALLNAGGDRDKVGEGGRSALMRAVLGGHSRCVRALVGARCDVNAADDDGVTPLAAAAALDHDDAAKIIVVLLDAGADPTRADMRGVVPTQLAAAGGKVEALKLLLAGRGGEHRERVLHPAATPRSWVRSSACACYWKTARTWARGIGTGGPRPTAPGGAGTTRLASRALIERGAASFTVLE